MESLFLFIQFFKKVRNHKTHKSTYTTGNPLYPFNQMITHVGCPCNKTKYNTFVGVTVKNGQGKEYEKYKCRGCNMYMPRDEMREKISEVVSSMELTSDGDKALRGSLLTVFEMEESDITSRSLQLKSQKANTQKEIDRLTEAGKAYETSVKQYKQVNNPSEAFVIERTKDIEGIIGYAAVTEDNDPNGKLNKAGGYTAT